MKLIGAVIIFVAFVYVNIRYILPFLFFVMAVNTLMPSVMSKEVASALFGKPKKART